MLNKIIILIALLVVILLVGCPIYHFLGVYCPGCGVTRMFISIFQLNFYQAFRYNCLVFIYLIGYIGYYIIKIVAKKVYKNDIIVPNKILYLLILIAIVFGIIRNFEIFSWMAPTIVR